MGSVARHSLVYAVGTLLGKSISFIMLPVYTRYLTPADYGVIALIEMTLDVICILAGAQLVMGVFRFYHKTEVQAERDSVVSTALLGVAMGHVLVGSFAFMAAEPISRIVLGDVQHAGLVRIAAVAMAFASLSIVPLSFIRLQDRSGLFVTATVLKLFMSLSLNILFVVYFGMGVRGVFLSTLISNAVVGIGLTAWTFYRVGFSFSAESTRDLLRFGAPLIAVNFATFFVTFGGRFFLQKSADETAVGLYSLGYQFGFLLSVAHSPFDLVWDPKRFEVAKRPDRDALLARGFVYKNLVMFPVAAGIGLFVDDVLGIMATPAFFGAAAIVPIILAAYVFQGWGSQDIGILIRERTRLMWLIHWIAAAVAFVCFVVLIPRYYAIGAAIAALVVFAIRWLMIYLVSQRLWPVRYEWRPVIILMVLSVAVVVLGLLIPAWPVVARVAVKAVMYGAYLLGIWFLGVITVDERRQLLEGWQRIRGMLSGWWRSRSAPGVPGAS